jgi:replication-associated recombination protein RarA
VVAQQYLPDGLERGAFFSASPRGWEAEHQARLEAIREASLDQRPTVGESAAPRREDGE